MFYCFERFVFNVYPAKTFRCTDASRLGWYDVVMMQSDSDLSSLMKLKRVTYRLTHWLSDHGRQFLDLLSQLKSNGNKSFWRFLIGCPKDICNSEKGLRTDWDWDSLGFCQDECRLETGVPHLGGQVPPSLLRGVRLPPGATHHATKHGLESLSEPKRQSHISMFCWKMCHHKMYPIKSYKRNVYISSIKNAMIIFLPTFNWSFFSLFCYIAVTRITFDSCNNISWGCTWS